MSSGAAPAPASYAGIDIAKAPLPTLMSEARAAAEFAERRFSPLAATQLNWRPQPDAWSVAQCLDHLIVANTTYRDSIVAPLREGRYQPNFWARLPGLPRVFGPLLIRALRPDSKRRLKAPASFAPSASEIDPKIVRRFIDHQFELVDWMESCRDKTPERTIVSSPALAPITYSLLDAFRIIVVHQHRHLAQARRVTEAAGFPPAAASAG